MKNGTFSLALRLLGMSAFALVVLLCGLAATSSHGDVVAPAVTGLTIEPNLIDTSLRDQMITVTISLTDDLSGVEWFEVSFSPDNAPRQRVGFVHDTYYGVQEIMWTEVLTVSQYQAQGHWALRMIAYKDKAGNFDYQYPREICGDWPGRCFDESIVETEFFNGYIPQKYFLPLVGKMWWCRGIDTSHC